MNSITVFIMLDACRHDYVDKVKTPFLHRLSTEGFFSPVKPTFGFEPDAAYLAGLFPDEADGGAQYWYNPDESPFKISKYFPSFFDKLPDIPQKIIRKMLVIAARKNSRAPNLYTGRIPFAVLNQFSLTTKHSLDSSDFCSGKKTIFDLLREKNRKWLYHTAPEHNVSISAVCKRAEDELTPPTEFAFFHIGDLDAAGHTFGPDAEDLKEVLKNVDDGLENLYRIISDKYDKINFVVMGDHGMIKVQETIDIAGKLSGIPDEMKKEYLIFLDSTMARFWFFSERARAWITEKLADVKGGKIINSYDRVFFHLRYPHNYFGDLIFLAEPGQLIFPNYYQKSAPVKGMHGYTPEDPGQQAAFIIHSKQADRQTEKKPMDMRRVFPTLCELLKLDLPDKCNLKSMVKAA